MSEQQDNIIHLTDLDTGKGEKRKAMRASIFSKLGGAFCNEPHCAYCDRPLTQENGPAMATVDHVIPRSLAQHLEHSWCNLLACCRRCNNSKADKPDWRIWLRSQHFYDPDREADIQAMLSEWGIAVPVDE